MNRFFVFASFVVISSAIVGCANLSEVELRQKRIDGNPALFGSLPPKVQERVCAGEVEEGDDTAVVGLALGKPKFIFKSEIDGTETWRYFRIEEHPRTVTVSDAPLSRRLVDVDPTSYTNVQIVTTEVLSHKLTIKDGKVIKAESF